MKFQHAAARRRLVVDCLIVGCSDSFNTQPPEGGWVHFEQIQPLGSGFNTQPPEGGWVSLGLPSSANTVSTRSRPKAAGQIKLLLSAKWLFQHAAARRRLGCIERHLQGRYSFNTQPPEGGWRGAGRGGQRRSRFNTQPPEGGWPQTKSAASCFLPFQHAAARRRLACS